MDVWSALAWSMIFVSAGRLHNAFVCVCMYRCVCVCVWTCAWVDECTVREYFAKWAAPDQSIGRTFLSYTDERSLSMQCDLDKIQWHLFNFFLTHPRLPWWLDSRRIHLTCHLLGNWCHHSIIRSMGLSELVYLSFFRAWGLSGTTIHLIRIDYLGIMTRRQ